MKTKLIFLLIIFLMLSGGMFAQTYSASDFVRSFYKFHRARSGDFNSSEVNAHRKWFSNELYELFQNELKREKEYLKQNPTNKPFFGDGFSFTPYEECYQNGKEIKNVLKIGSVAANADKTLVEVNFYYPKVCGGEMTASYQVELIKNKGVWVINDLIYSDGSTLILDLKRIEY